MGSRREEDERRRPYRLAFADLVLQILEAQELTHRDFAEKLGWSNHTRLYPYLRGQTEPHHELVFEMERVLGVEPGRLSRALGYLPITEAPPTFPDTFAGLVDKDPALDDRTKRILKLVYAESTDPAPVRRRRR